MTGKRIIAFCAAAVTAILAGSVRVAHAQPTVVRIPVGKAATLRFKNRILSIHVFNPKITDVRSYTPTSLVLVGLKRGTTFVEVKFKGRTVRIKVQVVKKNEQKAPVSQTPTGPSGDSNGQMDLHGMQLHP